MNIELINRQKLFRIPSRAIKQLARELIPPDWKGSRRQWNKIILFLMDDDGIRAVNRKTFLRDAPTDVITVTYQAIPGSPLPPAPEIFVNIERAHDRAGGRSLAVRRELALYIAHGLDHLLGGRDETPRQRAAMLRCEREWLRQAERKGLLAFDLKPIERLGKSAIGR